MFLTTRVRYGVRALIEIGMSSGPVLLKDISKKQDLSLKYLDHIFTRLKTKGILRKIKAKKGGYLLAKEPKEITLYDIIDALEGISGLECIKDVRFCSRAEECGARIVWDKLNGKITEVLKSITLDDFIEAQQKINRGDRPIFFSI
ncbi:MAG: Rrf2 family transcriptional regulator [bacterium]|nr:Rrf2 family transcriptional regulator [bacterium]